jgi:hypothetical protein
MIYDNELKIIVFLKEELFLGNLKQTSLLDYTFKIKMIIWVQFFVYSLTKPGFTFVIASEVDSMNPYRLT